MKKASQEGNRGTLDEEAVDSDSYSRRDDKRENENVVEWL